MYGGLAPCFRLLDLLRMNLAEPMHGCLARVSTRKEESVISARNHSHFAYLHKEARVTRYFRKVQRTHALPVAYYLCLTFCSYCGNSMQSRLLYQALSKLILVLSWLFRNFSKLEKKQDLENQSSSSQVYIPFLQIN